MPIGPSPKLDIACTREPPSRNHNTKAALPQPQDDEPKFTQNSVLASANKHLEPSTFPVTTEATKVCTQRYKLLYSTERGYQPSQRGSSSSQLQPGFPTSSISLSIFPPGPCRCQFFFYQPQPSLPPRLNCPFPKLSKVSPLATCKWHAW